MEQDAPVDPLARPEGIKRLGEDYPEDGYQTTQEAKQQRIGLVENMIEAMEDETVKIATLYGELQMRICEEAVGLSYIATAEAELWKKRWGRRTLEESVPSSMIELPW